MVIFYKNNLYLNNEILLQKKIVHKFKLPNLKFSVWRNKNRIRTVWAPFFVFIMSCSFEKPISKSQNLWLVFYEAAYKKGVLNKLMYWNNLSPSFLLLFTFMYKHIFNWTMLVVQKFEETCVRIFWTRSCFVNCV